MNVISAAFFSSYMYIVKAAETTFVQKICMFNIDEIDGRARGQFFQPLRTKLKYASLFHQQNCDQLYQ